MKTGEFLKNRRLELNLTQAFVSSHMGYFTNQFVSNCERGVSFPPRKTLKRLCSILKCKVKEVEILILEDKISILQNELLKVSK